MERTGATAAWLALVLASGCSSASSRGPAAPADSGAVGEDAAPDVAIDAGDLGDGDAAGGAAADGGDGDAGDAGDGGCFLSTVGVYGECITISACAAMAGWMSTPGYCPGPADIECCTKTPNVADNPPVPPGWVLMPQSAVTPEMTTWAVSILNDPVTYPMFSTTTRMFGSLNVMARVEWHPPDFQNNTVHRGVTLYEPG